MLENKYGAYKNSNTTPWFGCYSISYKICCNLNLSRGFRHSIIIDVMKAIVKAKKKGTKYDTIVKNLGRGRIPIIDINSEVAQVIVNASEFGMSLKTVW